jgi:hypothetical protein
MKTGFLAAAYDCSDFLDKSLSPFILYSLKNNSKISVVHSCFQEFFDLGNPILSKDGTHRKLTDYYNNGSISYLNISDKPLSEAAARNLALKPLLEAGCDTIILLDASDELFTLKQIKEIVEYVENNPETNWFRLSLRNYYQTENQYLADLFTPPRIWKVDCPPFKLNSFNYDNNILFEYGTDKQLVDQNILKNKTINIPIKHLSWLSNSRSRDKILYQNTRWSSDKKPTLNGDGCSYKWDELTNSVQFNEIWFKKNKLPIPKVITESSTKGYKF